MAKSITKETAEKLLGNCSHEQCFWLADGQALHSLSDLDKALKTMKKGVFEHHVNKDKNDFKNWIQAIIGDPLLAEKVGKAGTKTALAKAVKARVTELAKAMKKPAA